MARILIVEDQPDTQALLRLFLEAAGHSISTADDGATAMRLWNESRFDLVLLDYLLPDVSGLDLLKHFQPSAQSRQGTPILMLTASQDTHLLEQAFAHGAVDFLRKPFIRSELLARVGNVLGAAQQYRQLNELYQTLNRDLNVAGRVQRLFLPQMPVKDAIDCGWYYQPLEGVSGDGIGLRELDSGKYLFYLGDVSGHGVQAALLISALKTCFDHLVDQAGDSLEPWQLAAELNHRLEPLLDRHYITLLIGCLNTSNGQLSLFNAGHPPPLLMSQGRMQPLAANGSMPLGLQAQIDESAQSVHTLRPGDRLLTYSDGLFATSATGYADFLARLDASDWEQLSCTELCAGLPPMLQPVPDDDLTLMAIELRTLCFEQRCELSLPAVETLGTNLAEWLTGLGLESMKICLAWLEYGNNLVHHGQPETQSRGQILLKASLQANSFTLLIEDEGPAWELPVSVEVDPLAESGRGLWLIRQMSQEFSIQRTENSNQALIRFAPEANKCMFPN